MVVKTKSNAVTEFMEALKSDPHMPEWKIRQAHDEIRQSRRPLSYQNPPPRPPAQTTSAFVTASSDDAYPVPAHARSACEE